MNKEEILKEIEWHKDNIQSRKNQIDRINERGYYGLSKSQIRSVISSRKTEIAKEEEELSYSLARIEELEKELKE